MDFSSLILHPWRELLEWRDRDGLKVGGMMYGIPFRMPEPTLLAVADEDAEALAAVHRAAFPRESEHWGVRSFRELLSRPEVFAIKAVHLRQGGEGELGVRGFVLVREAAGDAEILTLAVHPAWQGRALGRLLMEEALRVLYARRAVSLFLEVAADNEAALRLYRRVGFDEVGRRDGYYARGRQTDAVAALTMRLDL